MIEQTNDRRERIMSGAGRLFRDKGYHGTSMADIGAAVGLEKGSLYTHIAAKQDLLRELAERGAGYFMAALAPIAASSDAAPDRLRRALRAHLGVVADHPDLAAVFLQEWRRLDGEARERIGRLRDEYEGMWRQIVAQGVREGSFRAEVDPRFGALLLLSVGNWAHQWLDARGPLSPDEVADVFAGLILDGMASAEDV